MSATTLVEFKPVKDYAAWAKLPVAKKLATWKASIITEHPFELSKCTMFTTADGEKVTRYDGQGWLVISEATKEKIADNPEIKSRMRLVERHPLIVNKDTKGENIFQLVAPGGVTPAELEDIWS